MAPRSGASWRLSAALWAERRIPALARILQASPVIANEPTGHGSVYRGAAGGPLLVVIGDAGSEPQWLGSALASALGGIAVVMSTAASEADVAEGGGDPERSRIRILDLIASATSIGADPGRVAVVGVGDGCAAALVTLAEPLTAPGVRRLVLLTPTSAPEIEFGGVPPTFLQSAPESATLAASRSLEIDLRNAGVAVRPVEYTGLPDAWVRYPHLTRGSKRAVEEIVAFLRRGFGMAGTFPIEIPGWDLK